MLLYFTILSARVSFAVVFICIVSLRKYTIVFYKTNHIYLALLYPLCASDSRLEELLLRG